MADKSFMILGGGGMVGFQIAHRICRYHSPEKIVIVSLYQQEVREAVKALEREFSEVEAVGFWGDIFVRAEFNIRNRQQRPHRGVLLKDSIHRSELYEDLFGEFPDAYDRSQMVQLIREHRPDVIIDAINTATAISYQDIYTASKIARRDLDSCLELEEDSEGKKISVEKMVQSIESLLVSQYMPQLVRHVLFINQAMREVGTRIYVKVGTTGTGGMGLNIPYTHGEDKPSAKLMSKTAIAFAHTGLLFLMARTHGGPIVKEVKPAAMVAWVDTSVRTIKRRGKPAYVYTSQNEKLGRKLRLRKDEVDFSRRDKLKMAVADTGENGVFTKGEFETITALRQMEFLTPEEIARAVVLEIEGINTGKDVIPAIDSAIMGPTYRAGYLRRQVIDDLRHLEEQTKSYSVALGELGPPELSKLLWEAFLLKEVYDTLSEVLGYAAEENYQTNGIKGNSRRSPNEIAENLNVYLEEHPDVRDVITSVGVPILLPDGKTLLRGTFIRIPEVPDKQEVDVLDGDIEKWALKGWVDLRPDNMEKWQYRFDSMSRARQRLQGKGSAAVNREAYLFNKIFIGEVVGWVFNNEMGGYRIK